MGVCAGGGGAGVCGGESMLGIEDSLMGFGGGVLDLCCFSEGSSGGANFGGSGIGSDGGVEMGKDDVEPLEQIDGGFGGAIGGGFKKEKSSSIMGWTGLLRPSMKSGGGRIKVPGGGGGAIEGGGGTIISPSTRSGTDITDPLDQLPPLTREEKRERTTNNSTVLHCAAHYLSGFNMCSCYKPLHIVEV